MGSKYSSQSVSSFNASPPVDDGSATEANKVKWSSILNKLASPLKTFAEAINTALVTALDQSCRTVSASDSAAATDHNRTIQVTTSSVTITLADASTMAAGYIVSVANTSSGNITVALATSTDTIDGVTNTTEVIPTQETRRYIVNTAATGYITSSSSSRRYGAIASGRNITASRASASTIDIDADEVVLRDSSGRSFLATSVNLTLDISTSTANGLDTGAEASSTWYYGYVIAKPDGTVAGLLSTSATSPTMPTGYTYKALITAARNDGSSNFLAYRQRGNDVFFEAGQSAISGGSAGVETSVSVSGLVPPSALDFSIHISASVTTSAGGSGNATFSTRYISGSVYTSTTVQVPQASQSVFDSLALRMPNISQQFYYAWSGLTANVSADSFSANVLGFKLPGGGE